MLARILVLDCVATLSNTKPRVGDVSQHADNAGAREPNPLRKPVLARSATPYNTVPAISSSPHSYFGEATCGGEYRAGRGTPLHIEEAQGKNVKASTRPT